jgi:hypothetical protein
MQARGIKLEAAVYVCSIIKSDGLGHFWQCYLNALAINETVLYQGRLSLALPLTIGDDVTQQRSNAGSRLYECKTRRHCGVVRRKICGSDRHILLVCTIVESYHYYQNGKAWLLDASRSTNF